MTTTPERSEGPEIRGPRPASAAGLVVYLVVVFALAWAIELGPVRSAGYGPGRFPAMLWLVVVMFLPSIAAVIARRVERCGFGDAGLRWGRGRYHLAAWLLPFGVAAVAVGLTIAFGVGRFDPTGSTMLAKLPAEQRAAAEEFTNRWGVWLPVLAIVSGLTQGIIVTSFATFGEEFGWRGYLQPRLMHLGPVRSTVLVGVIWGIWHAPIIVQGHNYPGHPVAGVFLMIAFCVVWSVILGWLFLASRSVLAPTIAHASINSPAASLGVFVAGADWAIGNITGVIGITVAGCVALWLWRTGRLREPSSGEQAS